MGLLALALGIIIFIAASRLFKVGTPRLAYLTLVAGFGFWYWLPAANLLTVGFIGLDDFAITPAVDDAAWLTLLYEISALVLLALARPLFHHQPAPSSTETRDALVMILALVALISAAAYLVARFAAQGNGLLLELALGLTSAREGASFVNRSAGAGESLRVLWEILTIWTGLFTFGWYIVNRRGLSPGGLAAIASMTLMFVGTGTRAVLLEAIFVCVTGIATRPRPIGPVKHRPVAGRLAATLPLAALGTLVGVGFTSRFNADAGYAAAGPLTTIASSFVVNNDMMRELAYTLSAIEPLTEGWRDFMLTPFTYMLPAFIGFHKQIPAHVIAYNELRAGIDIEFGSGNVFPGIIADFRLAFAALGAPMFALFTTSFALSVDRLGKLIDDSQQRLAYMLAAFAYLFFSFRNITGALAMVGVFGTLLIFSLQGRAGRIGNRGAL